MGYFPLLCQWLSNRYNFKQYEKGRTFKIVAVILTFQDEFIHKNNRALNVSDIDCTDMCVHVHMCVHMCPCVWRQEVDLKNLPLLPFVLFSETGALTEPGANLVDRMHRMFPASQHCEGGSVLCAQPFLSLLRV